MDYTSIYRIQNFDSTAKSIDSQRLSEDGEITFEVFTTYQF